MVHRKISLIVLILALILPGCGGDAAQETGSLPTLVEFPTDLPSNTPGITPTTALPTSTPAVTMTSSFTPTVTASLTASLTFTPSNTTPPRPTSTFTLTRTFTPAPATLTPEISNTPDTPQIISFQASSTTAVGGGTVELTWEAAGDIARIDRLNQLGQVVQTFSVTPSGQLPVTIPANEGSTITYRLAITRGSQEVTSTLTITVSGGAANCSINWFFGNEFAPPEVGCPTAVASQVAGVYQPFQTGRMIYLQSTNKIYTLVEAGGVLTEGAVTENTNGWDGTSTYQSSGCGNPPGSGLFEPQQMFVWLYCQTMGPGGLWNTVLGFGTTAADNSQRTIQLDSSGALYVDVPGGAVYRLPPVPAGQLSSTWKKIK
ncbi:MAG: hypothetical protein H7X77_09920 [Anaerolineae bacterium]|nr:hypothetical protein [Anaerolineae bacterium]